jgi:hypothetical protein
MYVVEARVQDFHPTEILELFNNTRTGGFHQQNVIRLRY